MRTRGGGLRDRSRACACRVRRSRLRGIGAWFRRGEDAGVRVSRGRRARSAALGRRVVATRRRFGGRRRRFDEKGKGRFPARARARSVRAERARTEFPGTSDESTLHSEVRAGRIARDTVREPREGARESEFQRSGAFGGKSAQVTRQQQIVHVCRLDRRVSPCALVSNLSGKFQES